MSSKVNIAAAAAFLISALLPIMVLLGSEISWAWCLPVRLHGEFRRITGRGADPNKTTRMTLSGYSYGSSSRSDARGFFSTRECNYQSRCALGLAPRLSIIGPSRLAARPDLDRWPSGFLPAHVGPKRAFEPRPFTW